LIVAKAILSPDPVCKLLGASPNPTEEKGGGFRGGRECTNVSWNIWHRLHLHQEMLHHTRCIWRYWSFQAVSI